MKNKVRVPTMVEFNKQTYKLWVANKIDAIQFVVRIHDFTWFFDDKIELGQLIPCKDGKPLDEPEPPEEPYLSDDQCDVYIQWQIYKDRWEEAEKRVWYDGFELEQETHDTKIISCNGHTVLMMVDDNIQFYIKTHEDLQPIAFLKEWKAKELKIV